MATDWQLIRDTLNATIDACEKLEPLAVSMTERGDPRACAEAKDSLAVGDFFNRFWHYPEGAQRDIIRLRSKLDTGDQKYYTEFARSLINTARACAQIIGVSGEHLEREADGFLPHCPSAGRSVKSQLSGIGSIYHNWMVPGITRSITEYREKYTEEERA